jgi:hypothetical protein
MTYSGKIDINVKNAKKYVRNFKIYFTLVIIGIVTCVILTCCTELFSLNTTKFINGLSLFFMSISLIHALFFDFEKKLKSDFSARFDEDSFGLWLSINRIVKYVWLVGILLGGVYWYIGT